MKRARTAVLAGALVAGGLTPVLVAAPAGADPVTVALSPAQVSLAGSSYYAQSVFETPGTGASDVHVTLADPATHPNDPTTAVAAGTFSVATPLSALATTEPALTAVANGATEAATPDIRLSVDFDGDGLTDGTLVGVGTEQPDWYLLPDGLQFVKNGAPCVYDSTDGTDTCDPDGTSTLVPGSAWHGTLAQWSAAFPNAVVDQAGYQVGPDGPADWDIQSLALGPTTYTFGETVPGQPDVVTSPYLQAPTETGTVILRFLQASLYLHTTGTTSSVSDYFSPVGGSVPLGQIGQPEVPVRTDPKGWVGSGNAATASLRVDLDGDGTPDVVLQPESNGSDGNDRWTVVGPMPVSVQHRAPSCLLPGSDCSQAGATIDGSLTAWAQSFPDAQVTAVGFAIPAGRTTDGTISSILAGSTKYTFANTPPTANPDPYVAAPITYSPTASISVDLSTLVTDPDPGDKLFFTDIPPDVSDDDLGSASVSGTVLTYTPDIGAAGSNVITYYFDDNINYESATIDVEVDPAPSTVTMTFSPKKPTTQDVPTATVTVNTTGDPSGGTVQVKVGKQKYLRVVGEDGTKVTVPLHKFLAGAHAVTATFLGTPSASVSPVLSKTLTVVKPAKKRSKQTLVRANPLH